MTSSDRTNWLTESTHLVNDNIDTTWSRALRGQTSIDCSTQGLHWSQSDLTSSSLSAPQLRLINKSRQQ